MGDLCIGPLCNSCDGEALVEDAVFEAHDCNDNSETLPCQAIHYTCATLSRCHHPGMGWERVDVLRSRIKEYRSRTGKTLAQVAKELGTSHGTLRFWLSGTRPPKKENLQKLAALLRCSITDFIDDPGASPTGSHHEKWIDATERDRIIASAMFHDITADELTESEKDELYLAYKEAKDRILRLRKNRDQGDV